MKPILVLLLILSVMGPKIVFKFNKSSDPKAWIVINDTVMGGVSSAKFSIDAEGHGMFEGHVSLENNGGFASVRHTFNTINVDGAKTVRLKLKGDGKRYQFRVKSNADDYYSYVITFKTNGKWQEIYLPLADMQPRFRGRHVDKPNFDQAQIAEVGFLIGNKEEEHFELLIDSIELM